jgi:hypothetical protein
MIRVAWTRLEREVLVERLGAVVLGVDEQRASADAIGRLPVGVEGCCRSTG